MKYDLISQLSRFIVCQEVKKTKAIAENFKYELNELSINKSMEWSKNRN